MNKRKNTLFLFCLLTLCSTPFRSFAQSAIAQSLEGNWVFTASPFDGGSDEIAFTATLSTDGTSLDCHAEQFFTRASRPYPMDWKLSIEENGNQLRLGWVLSETTPASSLEFQESANCYIMGGANADGTPRYIYLLSENIDTQKLEAMTLWTDWQSTANATFNLPKIQQIYAVVSKEQPYNGAIGYMDIWASGKLRKNAGTGINQLPASNSTQHPSPIYDLQGRRLSQPVQKGIYIRDGKKYYIH